MQTVCCVCHKTKSQRGWIQKQAVKKGRISHGYCPECYRRSMEQAQGWLRARNAGSQGLTLAR